MARRVWTRPTDPTIAMPESSGPRWTSAARSRSRRCRGASAGEDASANPAHARNRTGLCDSATWCERAVSERVADATETGCRGRSRAGPRPLMR